jgi:hypothetical protein
MAKDDDRFKWQADAMFEYAKLHDSPEMKVFNEIIETCTKKEEQAR